MQSDLHENWCERLESLKIQHTWYTFGEFCGQRWEAGTERVHLVVTNQIFDAWELFGFGQKISTAVSTDLDVLEIVRILDTYRKSRWVRAFPN